MKVLDTRTAEEQFHWLCRIVESDFIKERMQDAVESGHPSAAVYDILVKQVRTAPVYLWSDEKRERAIEYSKQDTLSMTFHVMDVDALCPVITADSEGATVLNSVSAIGERIETRSYFSYVINPAIQRHEMLKKKGIPEEQIKSLYTKPQLFFYMVKLIFEPDHPGDPASYRAWVEDASFMMWTLDSGSRKVEGRPDVNASDTELVGESRHQIWKTAFDHVRSALEQMIYTLAPRTVVVKDVPAKPRNPEKRTKRLHIPRRHEREVHIIFDPEEVQELRARPETVDHGGTHASPRPHVRRAHKRTFKADRYKKAKGKTVEVGPIFVNCSPGDRFEFARRFYHIVSVGGRREE